MQKLFKVTEEEMKAIEKAVSDSLNLWNYDFIEANDGNGSGTSMSKESFFENLRSEFIIEN